jgi:AraC-like DNA-binding protein
MLYRSYTPGMPLAAHVDHLWMLSDVPAHPHERVVPSGTLELVINLAEDEFRIYDPTDARRIRRYSGAVISGAFSRCFGIDTREHASIVGVHFKPGGAYPFLGLPLHELADSHVDLETLWGLEARGLRERLCRAAPMKRFSILEGALCDRLTPVRHHPAVSEALAQLSQRAVPVGDLARQSGLSHRRFIELFRAEVGMAPKRFSRLRRFERAAVYARSNTPDWARLALDCGYFDQSHMIADFLAFSGFTPAQFLGRATPAVKDGHVIG